ncbi:MAG: GNAT family N-acetyltransferase [Myxococcales bacterium]|nr:GNAT family N-acetyltransferase [Myxococcales bacterium]MCB9531973.1 GNAT family N-acetyltransferase [Myxococcales bacterium]MCB9532814.1 GNAT family N-acetyltransferase [Myxococcales bacterium]
MNNSTSPSPPTPTPAPVVLQLDPGVRVRAFDDPHSDRLRCDHPDPRSADQLGERLLEVAEELDRARVVALVPISMEAALDRSGFTCEATIPGFYRGVEDCAVMGAFLDPTRGELAHPIEDRAVLTLLDDVLPTSSRRDDVETRLAGVEDAVRVAELLAETFDDYPTPSHDPRYVEAQILAGTPFRVVEDGGGLVACASADLVPAALAAELTDCATRPSHRGRGLMQAILTDLMGDLEARDYATAFTLARARIPGVNLAFARLGFDLHGCMVQSCRIGTGIEDMNVWSRALP